MGGGEYSHPRSGHGGGVPPSKVRMRVPPCPGQVPGQDRGTPNGNSTACTCYTADGVPLAFTQEDFTVLK